MDTAYVSAIAALAGSAIGGLTSLAASWLTQRVQLSAQQLAHDIGRREELYKDFIEEASQSYTHAWQHSESEADVSKLVRLYAIVSRMRVLSSTPVIEQADRVMRVIIQTYVGPNKTIREAAESVQTGLLDPLRDFSEACRDELRAGLVVRRIP
jgi:hypothetical protein